jgi:hypothetical protein
MATKATKKARGWLGSWARAVTPPGYAQAILTLIGTSPLLMNSSEYDRASEHYRTLHLLGKKKGKSLDDQERLLELEWELALYFDDEIGPYIPGRNIKELLRAAATKWRKGEEVKRSLVVLESRVPLLYDGPRTRLELREQGYHYDAMVANAGAGSGRVDRRRPCFPEWSLVAELAYDPEDLDFDFLGLVAERAQKYGLGDYRPTFGAFTAELVAGELRKPGANGREPTPRKILEERAHQAFRNRIEVT